MRVGAREGKVVSGRPGRGQVSGSAEGGSGSTGPARAPPGGRGGSRAAGAEESEAGQGVIVRYGCRPGQQRQGLATGRSHPLTVSHTPDQQPKRLRRSPRRSPARSARRSARQVSRAGQRARSAALVSRAGQPRLVSRAWSAALVSPPGQPARSARYEPLGASTPAAAPATGCLQHTSAGWPGQRDVQLGRTGPGAVQQPPGSHSTTASNSSPSRRAGSARYRPSRADSSGAAGPVAPCRTARSRHGASPTWSGACRRRPAPHHQAVRRHSRAHGTPVRVPTSAGAARVDLRQHRRPRRP